MASTLWIGVSTIWVSTFLYGIYLVLFCRCMYTFYQVRGKRPLQPILLTSAVLMFLLSTCSVLVYVLEGATTYGKARLNLDSLQVANVVVYVTNNVLADALLIYRCWVIWRTIPYRIWIIIPPTILLIATMLLGYLVQLKLFFIISLTNNLFIPTLVAGRLWWLVRRIPMRSSTGAETRRKGQNAVVIIIESGLIYSLIVSIHMVYFHMQNPIDDVVYAALTQVVGIVPTLLIVRVGLGLSQEGNSTTNSDMANADSPTGSEQFNPSTTRSAPPAYMTYVESEGADAEDRRTIVGSMLPSDEKNRSSWGTSSSMTPV